MVMYSSESPLAATPHGNKNTLALTGPDKGHLAPVHPVLPGHGAGSPLDCVTAVNRALPVVAVAAMMLGLPWCQEGTQTTPPGPLELSQKHRHRPSGKHDQFPLGVRHSAVPQEESERRET